MQNKYIKVFMVICLTMSAGNLCASDAAKVNEKPGTGLILESDVSIQDLQNAVENITKDLNSVPALDKDGNSLNLPNGDWKKLLRADDIKPVTIVATSMVDEQTTPQMTIFGYPMYHRIQRTVLKKEFQGSLKNIDNKGDGKTCTLRFSTRGQVRPTVISTVHRNPTQMGYLVGGASTLVTAGALRSLFKRIVRK